MANLAGGKWGLAQFVWIPRAIEYDLSTTIAEAFRELVDEASPLAQRVDASANRCTQSNASYSRKADFCPNWQSFRLSAAFVAMVLTGYDPSRYTFYSKGALRHGYERYAPDATQQGSGPQTRAL